MSEREKERRRRARAKKKRARRRLNLILLLLATFSIAILVLIGIQVLPAFLAGRDIKKNVELKVGIEPITDVSVFLDEGADAAQASFVTDMKSVDYAAAGEHEVKLLYKDNPYTSMLTLVDDEPPVFESAEDFTTILGEPITYKSHVKVSDNSGKCELTVDSGKVKPNEAGTYDVTYTATDTAGNSSSVTGKMTIIEETAEEKDLNERIDKILAEIITEDMSQKDKTWAIFSYIRNHVGYVSSSEKGDYVKAALQAVKQGQGDCYVYFSIAKAMLTRAGIKNMDIERIPEGDKMHYWNLVDIEDGHGWYHYDTTPRVDHPTIYLWDDAKIKAYSDAHDNCHNYDRSKYPDIP